MQHPNNPAIGTMLVAMGHQISALREQIHVACPESHSGPPILLAMAANKIATTPVTSGVARAQAIAWRVERRLAMASVRGSGWLAKSSKVWGAGRKRLG